MRNIFDDINVKLNITNCKIQEQNGSVNIFSSKKKLK